MSRNSVILGIVAEYDPFHNGHEYHLKEALKATRPDTVYAVLSPCMKQRGTLSMLSPFDRAACALHSGVDAAFLLPVLWAVRDAENYALGAVSLLCGLGITHISFGVETSDFQLLQKTADFLDNPPDAFFGMLKSFLKEGTGYPAAMGKAVSALFPDCGRLLNHPNNILGICYLRALRKIGSDVVPVMIQRKGHYHSLSASADSPSASAVRNALSLGNYAAAFQAMPAFSAGIVKKAMLSRRVPDQDIWNSMVTERLRFSDISTLPDLSEGLDAIIRREASRFDSAEEIINAVCSRRYTASRISRLCAMAMLNVTDERIRHLALPSLTLLLALRKEKVPTDQWKDLPVRVAVSPVEWAGTADPEDMVCWRLWSACSHLPDSLPFTERIYTE